MKKLHFLYDQLAGVRFGFTTGCFTGVFAAASFVEVAGSLVPYPYYGSAVDIAYQSVGAFLGCVVLVRFLGIFYRSFMVHRSCAVDGDSDELKKDIASLKRAIGEPE
jgi:hypothetical protein